MMNATRITNWFGFLCIVFVNDVHSNKEIHIGGILSSISGEQFRRLVDNMRAPENYTFKGVSIVAVNNSVKTASDICDHLVPQKVRILSLCQPVSFNSMCENNVNVMAAFRGCY